MQVLQPLTILAALHRTCSISSTAFLSAVAQNWIQYSRYGLTSIKNRGIITSLDLLAIPLLVQLLPFIDAKLHYLSLACYPPGPLTPFQQSKFQPFSLLPFPLPRVNPSQVSDFKVFLVELLYFIVFKNIAEVQLMSIRFRIAGNNSN